MMEVSAFARQVLLSESLSDKLYSPARFSDQNPEFLKSLPERPARQAKFALAESMSPHPFPKAKDLESRPQTSAEIFHFFANHELLALELMAWVLLKYPNLPRALRLGLASTMLEEQKHMRLYLEQMHQRGMELGALPMGAHFWNVIASTQDPREFLAGMSLTFEQANLDFARDWKNNFEKLQMHDEASVMQIVYEEEIGHVKHGLHWLRELGEPGMDDFELHQRYLPKLLSLRKAKTDNMDISARLRAGLSHEYIEKLSLCGGSKSRSPDLIFLQTGADLQWSKDKSDFRPILERDTACLGFLWASADDLVCVPQIPSLDFQKQIQSHWGFNPVWVENSVIGDLHSKIPRIRQVVPWAWGPDADRFGQLLGDLKPKNWPKVDTTILGQWASKSYSARLLGLLEQIDPLWDLQAGLVFEDSGILDYLAKNDNIIVKSMHSASGQGRLFTSLDAPENWSKIIQKMLKSGPVLAEPFRQKVMDLSALFVIEDSGVRLMGVTRFDTDQRGTWRGSMISSAFVGLPPQLLQFLRAKIAGQTRMDLWTQSLQNLLSQELWQQGFRGPVGIDALIYQSTDGQLGLRPIVELNSRMTFGHLALRLRKKVDKNTPARLRLRRLSSLRKLGFTDASDWLSSQPQIGLNPHGQFTQGTLPLADPQQAQQFLPVMEIGPPALDSNLT